MKDQNVVSRSIKYAFVKLYLKKGYDYNKFRFKVSAFPHYGVYNETLALLKKRGWTVTKDPEIESRHKILSKYRRYAKKGDLELSIHIYETGIEFKFFQNAVFENPHGGKYDFDPYNKMPYLLKKYFLLESQYIMRQFMRRFAAVQEVHDAPIDPREFILHNCWTRSFTKNKITGLDEMESFMSDYDHSQNSWDRDKKKIKCGETKYFRDYNGYIQRGKVYHNINNMWWVITGPYSFTNIASFRLFDATQDDISKRRDKDKRIPKQVTERYKSLSTMSESDLLKELARRKKGASSPVPIEP